MVFRYVNDGDLHVDGKVLWKMLLLENALEKLEKLTGYTFDYKKDGKASAGVLSTEVEQVLP